MTIRVGVLGASGRMGAETCRAVENDGELELVARVTRGDPLETLVENRADVAVDFTVPNAVKHNVRFCVDNGIHAVVGASGLSEGDLADVRTWVQEGRANVFVAPNFAIGAVLMMRFAQEAAVAFDRAEIVERHHERKLDAPSGTALRTASLMNERRTVGWQVSDADGSRPGARGADAGGIKIHSLRVPGSVAHQEVILGAPGETLTIRHDSLDRVSFMPGVILAVKRVASRPGVTFGLEHLLEL